MDSSKCGQWTGEQTTSKTPFGYGRPQVTTKEKNKPSRTNSFPLNYTKEQVVLFTNPAHRK